MKRLCLSTIFILFTGISSVTQAGPTIFGVDSVGQQLVSFNPWTGEEIRRMNLPSGISTTDTEIGLAGSRNFELFYANSDVDHTQVYVLDSRYGSIKRTFSVPYGEPIGPMPYLITGLAYESSTNYEYIYAVGCTEVQDMHRIDAVNGDITDLWWGGHTLDNLCDAVGGDNYGRIFAFTTTSQILELDPLEPDWYRAMDTDLTGVVGMAYDGTYLYASTLGNMVYVLDPDTASVLNSTLIDYTLYALGAAPVVISAPDALVLGGIGIVCIRWLRRRRKL